ncbi:RNA polymerase factor sigma-54 [Clostridium sp. E02]|uniref:RNA polymerase factor sigma-54 n=1 Tax=Clostridium sp. E02 TaxID=2487134 RepID=UPI000F5310C6|nr:RNA polymerase factor sigma-54 [Clostridium sp. E02]
MSDLFLNLEQKQTLSQKVIQNIEILQMSTNELELYLNNISLENPVIELNDKSRISEETPLNETDLYHNNHLTGSSIAKSFTDGGRFKNVASTPENSLTEHVLFQLIPFFHTEQNKSIFYFLVDSLNDNGFLTVTINDICSLFKITPEEADYYICTLQSLEPAGIGAGSLAECLILQLKRISNPIKDLSIEILTSHMENLANNQLKLIAQKLKVPLSDIIDACELIKSLNPKPGNGFCCKELATYVQPDIIVLQRHNNFQITICNDFASGFTISNSYRNLLNHPDKEVREYLYQKFQQAEWLNKCLEQRNVTLLRITQQLLINQKNFFLNGPDNLKPLKQSDLGSQLNLNNSTISRAIHDKYLQCFWGVFPLKYFFSKAASNQSDLTSLHLKHQIKQLIDTEDKKHPLSDQKIADLLAQDNINIARRTVAKYRTELLIPDTSKRRSL